MKKAVILFLTVVMVFSASACNAGPGGHTRAARKELMTLLSGDSYYIKDTANIGGELSVSEYTRLDELKYYGISYDGNECRYMKTDVEYVILNDVAKTATVIPIEKSEDKIFEGEKQFLEAVFSTSVDEGKYIECTVNENDDTAVESYYDKDGVSIWKFYYTADDKLSKIESLDGKGGVMAEYLLEYSDKGDINLFGAYNDYEIIERRQEK